MLNRAGEDIGDGLDTAMRVPGEASKVVFRTIIAKVIEQKKRIVLPRFAEAEGTVQLDSRTFPRRL